MRRWGGSMAATTCFAFAMIRALESGAAWQRYLWADAAAVVLGAGLGWAAS